MLLGIFPRESKNNLARNCELFSRMFLSLCISNFFFNKMGGDRKSTRLHWDESFSDKSKPRKIKQYFNPYTAETDPTSFSASAKKI